MKLLSVGLARSIWYFNIRDLNPEGISLFPAIRSLIERYKFTNVPSPQELIEQKPDGAFMFKGGEFTNSADKLLVVTLTAYEWGLIADTMSSTQDSDAFLADMLNHLSETFNLLRHEQIIRKINYVSHLNVSTDKSLELINPKLKEISKYLTNNVVGHKNVPFQTGGIHFWPDQIYPVHATPFSLDRAAGIPFAENRYFSASPLQTDKHIELLDKLEVILAS
ncbi:MAG: hypothetical protein M0018_01355 [Nitrospiraceae bacterium]|nr:hypothetical protein [Nitrospiraceae bacterium]